MVFLVQLPVLLLQEVAAEAAQAGHQLAQWAEAALAGLELGALVISSPMAVAVILR
jgi:hypothetical protein